MGIKTSTYNFENYHTSSAGTVTWDSGYYRNQQQVYANVLYSQMQTPKKEENTMELYTVYLIYAEDRKSPVVKRVDGVLAKNPEDAKVKSGLMKEVDAEWDSEFLTFIAEHIGTVAVKPRPTEVKSV